MSEVTQLLAPGEHVLARDGDGDGMTQAFLAPAPSIFFLFAEPSDTTEAKHILQ